MKKTKFLFLLTFFLSFCFISNVNAVDVKGWTDDLKTPTKVVFKTCNSDGTNCPTTVNANQYVVTIKSDGNATTLIERTGMQTASAIGGSTYFMVMHTLDFFLMKDYAYTITGYFCATDSYSSVFGVNSDYDQAGTSSFENKPRVAMYLENNSISNYVYTTDGAFNNSSGCRAISYFVVPSINSQYFGWLLKNYAGKSSYYTFMGYTIDSLGKYDSLNTSQITESVNTALQNSNLATASSIEEVQSSINKLNEEITSINNSITSEDSSKATGQAGSFFNDFTTDTFGLTSVITAPLSLINSITSNSCTPLNLPIPFVNKTLTLPCMNTIYQQYFSSLFTLYQTITFGIVAYWVCVRIFNLVKDFKNPDHDEVEVMEL